MRERAVWRWIGLIAALAGLVAVVAIGVVAGTSNAAESRRIVRVGLALATGDLGDRAFNDSAYAGLQQSQREMGLRFVLRPWRGAELQVDNLRELARERPDLIIAIGAENVAPLEQVAAEFPQQHFAIIDAELDAPNVTSVVFRELEGDFLAGALAALLSDTGTVGFLGGADIAVIRRIEHGWRQGVRHVNPDAQILVRYIAGENDFSGFNQPDRGLELTGEMFEQGAGVVYTPAGRSALGAIEAARQYQRLLITTGADQRWIAPDAVVTSRTKNMDTAVLRLVTELHHGTLQAGRRELDLSAGGVGLAPLDGSGLAANQAPLVPESMRERLAEIYQDLAAGRVTVEAYRP
jgi:basic membrane protein A